MAEEAKKTKAKEVKEAEIIAETVQLSKEVGVEKTEKATAKAGKRSAKSVREAEIKETKETKKSEKPESIEKPKQAKKPTRSRAERSGKKYREVYKLIEKDKTYAVDEAIAMAIKTSPTKFDATVELHINLGVDPKQADQNVRDMVVLPAGTGKEVKVAVFAEADDVVKAKKAGADISAGDEFLQQLDKEQLDFDVLISTPSLMPKLGKYARLLGPRGLMPNPKSGTVTTDVANAVKEAKAGRVEYRVDQAGIVHLGVGKVSFGTENLARNIDAVLTSVKAAKPTSLKGTYVQSTYLSTTMGPSIKFTT